MRADPGFGIYIHWPFCAAKCPYCDFNSHVRRDADALRYGRALVSDLRAQAARYEGARPQVTSIFFGGGTPSLMPGSAVADLIAAARELFPVRGDCEITLESNPTSADATRFRDYRAAGVNRLSLGVQSLDDNQLKFLGRWHSAAEALRALDLAQATFPRVSLDLIYARPGQTETAWRAELARALGTGISHLSAYQLTIEPATPFAALYKAGQFTLPEDDNAAALYEATEEVCAAHGLRPYEVSNYAKLGDESRHNLVYWRYGEYLGVGPGAHGRPVWGATRRATEIEKKPELYLQRIEETGAAFTHETAVAASDAPNEMLLMGLRLAEGLDRARFDAMGGRIDERAAARLVALGLLDISPTRLTATRAGRMVLNTLIAELSGV